MLRSTNKLHGCAIHATDGDLGKVDEFFFDVLNWTIRYLVVDTGTWLTGRRVLLSPAVLTVRRLRSDGYEPRSLLKIPFTQRVDHYKKGTIR